MYIHPVSFNNNYNQRKKTTSFNGSIAHPEYLNNIRKYCPFDVAEFNKETSKWSANMIGRRIREFFAVLDKDPLLKEQTILLNNVIGSKNCNAEFTMYMFVRENDSHNKYKLLKNYLDYQDTMDLSKLDDRKKRTFIVQELSNFLRTENGIDNSKKLELLQRYRSPDFKPCVDKDGNPVPFIDERMNSRYKFSAMYVKLNNAG